MKLKAENSDEAVTEGDETEKSLTEKALPRRRRRQNIPNTPSQKSQGRKNPSKRGLSIAKAHAVHESCYPMA